MGDQQDARVDMNFASAEAMLRYVISYWAVCLAGTGGDFDTELKVGHTRSILDALWKHCRNAELRWVTVEREGLVCVCLDREYLRLILQPSYETAKLIKNALEVFYLGKIFYNRTTRFAKTERFRN